MSEAAKEKLASFIAVVFLSGITALAVWSMYPERHVLSPFEENLAGMTEVLLPEKQRVSPSLSRCARDYAKYLADHFVYDHGADGKTALSRANDYGRFQRVAEVLTCGSTPEEAMAVLLTSAEHRSVFLKDWPKVGVGAAPWNDDRKVVVIMMAGDL